MDNRLNKIKEKVWVDRYAPKKLDDCILPPDITNNIRTQLSSGSIQSMLFYGDTGKGKTSVAKAICDELGYENMLINASKERGIDIIRNEVYSFAKNLGFSDSIHKVIVLDEADNQTSDAQLALKSLIEEVSSICRFIFTANYPERLDKALHSRVVKINFDYTDDESINYVKKKMFERCVFILNDNDVTFDDADLKKLLKDFFPDIRQCIHNLQWSCITDENNRLRLKYDSSQYFTKNKVEELFNIIIDTTNYSAVIQWLNNNPMFDVEMIMQELYRISLSKLSMKSVAHIISILSLYEYRMNNVINKNITLLDMCRVIMYDSKQGLINRK